jgi:chaperone LolA
MTLRRVLAFAAAWWLAVGSTAARQEKAPADLAARIQSHYLTVRDFSADFTLTQTTALLPKGSTDKGEVKVKKPLRMRWAYTTSQKQLFVSDGSQLYMYHPADKFVDVTPVPKDGGSSTALLFLAGQANLTRDFSPTVPAAQPATDLWRLTLKPRGQADFTTLTLDVARTTYALRGLTVVDDQGSSSQFQFTNLKENVGLKDAEFTFTPPRGVEVFRR